MCVCADLLPAGMWGIPVVSGLTFPGSYITQLTVWQPLPEPWKKKQIGIFLAPKWDNLFDLQSFMAFNSVHCKQGEKLIFV